MFKFELSEQMTMVVANALGNHPYKEAAPVIAEIQRQVNAQQQPFPSPNGKMEQETQNVRNRAEH